MRPWNDEALKVMTADLKVGVTVKDTRMIDLLEEQTIVTTGSPSLGFLTKEEMVTVRNLPNDRERMDKILEYLRKKQDKDFGNFCQILELSGHAALSTALKAKAAEFKAALGKCAQHFHMFVYKHCNHALRYIPLSFITPCFS